jgi:TetR/AcrR family transcriptional regulator, regulator of cefoperazone and chloramphenicol sensitivity
MRFCSALLSPTLSKSDQAKSRLLEAGLVIFGNKGLEAATVREIARAAGQNVAAIAYHFGGKDSLYRAVLEGIVREIRNRLSDVLEEISHFESQPEHPRAEALRLLKLFVQTVYLRLLSRNDALPMARLIIREQLQATAGFKVLYEQGFRHWHRALCFLVGIVLGRSDRDTDTILRTHTIMGQVYFFAMSREAILRRAGWRTLEGRNARKVATLVSENIDILAAGLAERRGNLRSATRT